MWKLGGRMRSFYSTSVTFLEGSLMIRGNLRERGCGEAVLMELFQKLKKKHIQHCPTLFKTPLLRQQIIVQIDKKLFFSSVLGQGIKYFIRECLSCSSVWASSSLFRGINQQEWKKGRLVCVCCHWRGKEGKEGPPHSSHPNYKRNKYH